jgi:hypothetical protein
MELFFSHAVSKIRVIEAGSDVLKITMANREEQFVYFDKFIVAPGLENRSYDRRDPLP